jgi:hypothetical protein
LLCFSPHKREYQVAQKSSVLEREEEILDDRILIALGEMNINTLQSNNDKIHPESVLIEEAPLSSPSIADSTPDRETGQQDVDSLLGHRTMLFRPTAIHTEGSNMDFTVFASMHSSVGLMPQTPAAAATPRQLKHMSPTNRLLQQMITEQHFRPRSPTDNDSHVTPRSIIKLRLSKSVSLDEEA